MVDLRRMRSAVDAQTQVYLSCVFTAVMNISGGSVWEALTLNNEALLLACVD